MFERFKTAKKVVSANKSAARINSFIRPCVFVAMKKDGSLNPELKDDPFVIAYIYGVISACVEGFWIGDTEEKGHTIEQVYEQLFPNNGRGITQDCNERVVYGNPAFREWAGSGYSEMVEVFNSECKQVLRSLMDHVVRMYS